MIATLGRWWTGLTRREQVLVGIAGALVAALLLVFAVILPLANGLQAAEMRHARVVDQSARVLARLHDLEAAPRRAAPAPLALDQVVNASAAEAGLALQAVQPQGETVSVTVAGARSGALLGWIDALARRGVVVNDALLTAGADGALSASLTLRQAGA